MEEIISNILIFLNQNINKEVNNPEFNPSTDYLSYVKKMSQDAWRLYGATHVAKFINSSSKTQDIICKKFETIDSILDTNSIDNLELDATCSAAFSGINKFLNLQNSKGKKVIDYIRNNELGLLSFLNITNDELQEIFDNFNKAYKIDDELRVDGKTKQIFFKVGDTYKTLIPLFSSSLQQKIFNKVSVISNSKEYYETLKAYKDNGESDQELVIYPDIALFKVGGAKPHNVSQLNHKRFGNVILFNTTPPKLQFSECKIKTIKDNIFFDRIFINAISSLLISLTNFFLQYKDADSNEKLRKRRDLQLKDIANTVVDKLYQCKDLNKEGFSDSLNLKKEHKYFIDSKYDSITPGIKTEALNVLATDLAEYSVVFINNKFKEKASFENINTVIDKFKKEFLEVFRRSL